MVPAEAEGDILFFSSWLTLIHRTTTELTTSFATWVANLIGLSNIEGGVEVVVRAVCSPFLSL